jgi:polysaccharide export outer membrane protein
MTTKTWIKIIKYHTTFALVVAALMLAGCGTTPTDSGESSSAGYTGAVTNASQTPDARENAPSPEILQPGDSISVTYSDLPTMTMPWEGEIKPDGTITLLLNQNFKAAGLTRAQLEKEIRDRYVPSFFKQMTVTIKPKQDTRFYYVGGEVRNPGRQVYLSRITILKAIQSAGDFTGFAKQKGVKLTRSGASKPIIVNCVKAREDSKLDVEIYPGDTIHVPRRLL